MGVDSLLSRVCAALDSAGVPYMLTGSLASSMHGIPRATQDVDIVIDPTRDGLLRLLKLFPESEFYVSCSAAFDAFERQGQFNLIDFKTGWKIDFIIRKHRSFSQTEFDRRSMFEFNGIHLMVATPEDVLIAKLEWAKLAESERQIDDAAGILRLQIDELDEEYVEKWIERLELEKQWLAAREKSGVMLRDDGEGSDRS